MVRTSYDKVILALVVQFLNGEATLDSEISVEHTLRKTGEPHLGYGSRSSSSRSGVDSSPTSNVRNNRLTTRLCTDGTKALNQMRSDDFIVYTNDASMAPTDRNEIGNTFKLTAKGIEIFKELVTLANASRPSHNVSDDTTVADGSGQFSAPARRQRPQDMHKVLLQYWKNNTPKRTPRRCDAQWDRAYRNLEEEIARLREDVQEATTVTDLLWRDTDAETGSSSTMSVQPPKTPVAQRSASLNNPNAYPTPSTGSRHNSVARSLTYDRDESPSPDFGDYQHEHDDDPMQDDEHREDVNTSVLTQIKDKFMSLWGNVFPSEEPKSTVDALVAMIEYLNKSHADDIDRMKMEMELTTGSLKNDHQRMIASLEEEHAKTVKELQDSLDGVRAENVELREAFCAHALGVRHRFPELFKAIPAAGLSNNL